MGALQSLRFYLRSKTSSIWRYALSEALQGLLAWMPSVIGVGLRAVFYKLFLRSDGLPAIEDHNKPSSKSPRRKTETLSDEATTILYQRRTHVKSKPIDFSYYV